MIRLYIYLSICVLVLEEWLLRVEAERQVCKSKIYKSQVTKILLLPSLPHPHTQDRGAELNLEVTVGGVLVRLCKKKKKKRQDPNPGKKNFFFNVHRYIFVVPPGNLLPFSLYIYNTHSLTKDTHTHTHIRTLRRCRRGGKGGVCVSCS